MATILEICNNALVEVGAEPLLDLVTNSKLTRILNLRYPQVKKSLLQEHPWNFAIRRANLVEDTAPVVPESFRFEKQFELPLDYLRIIRINNEKAYIYGPYGTFGRRDEQDWRVEGDRLYSNMDEVLVEYIANVDESLFSPQFTEALSKKLAYNICYSVIQSSSLRDSLRNDTEYYLKIARSIDAQEGFPEQFNSDEWLQSRL